MRKDPRQDKRYEYQRNEHDPVKFGRRSDLSGARPTAEHHPMTATAMPVTRKSALSCPVNGASMNIVCTDPGQRTNMAPSARYR